MNLIEIKSAVAAGLIILPMRFFVFILQARFAALASAVILTAGLAATAAEAGDLTLAKTFFPQASAITVEMHAGPPPSAALRAADGSLLGYAFSTRDVSGSVGYSGRAIDIVGAVTPEGVILGAQIVAHEEPILVIGIPRDAIAAYVANFKGYDVQRAGVQRVAGGAANGPHAVAGATVTSSVIRDAIIRSARAVLRSRTAAAVSPGKVRLDRETLRRSSWPALLADGALQRLTLSRGEAARLLATTDAEPEKPFIELWLALASPPAIGESLIGQRDYEAALATFAPDDDLLLIAANGLYSFKGTQWRRSGIFERIEIVQGDKTIPLRAEDHRPIDALRSAGAPEFREIGLFRIAHASGFDPTQPFRLDLALAAASRAASPAAPAVVSLNYRIPEKYLIVPSAPRAAAQSDTPSPGFAPTRLDEAAAPAFAPLWQDIWWARRIEVATLTLMLAGLGVLLIFQDAVTARVRLYHRLRAAFLILTFVFLGLIANAQLSVVNVVTFVHALLSGFHWELFLLDPLVFILWSFVAVSMLFWGRGVFCGWLCPFGALQELSYMLARRLGMRRVYIPFGLHERLWMIKYVIFLAILAVSLHSIMAAFAFAEIEPFKTAITLKFIRDWPFVIYAGALLAAGLFIERFFCRYLCPLGAALAIPARMRMFEWLKRRKECGFECQTCAQRCTVQAIHPLGHINPNECIYCLQCQANYFDHTVCPPLIRREERNKQRKAAALAMKAAAAQKETDGD